ncbi:MAG TPA: hypothetical protein VGB00_19390 [Pyrinomonadaceae bacterium]
MGIKFKDLKKIIKTGAAVGSIITGGKTKSVLDMVNETIDNPQDENNVQAFKDLAETDGAIIEVLKEHEKRLKALEENR